MQYQSYLDAAFLLHASHCVQDLYFETIGGLGKYCRPCISVDKDLSHSASRVFRHRVVLSSVIQGTLYCDVCHRVLTYTCPAECCSVCTTTAINFLDSQSDESLSHFKNTIIVDPVVIIILNSRTSARNSIS